MGNEFLGPYRLGPNDTPENGIYTGDARDLALAIPSSNAEVAIFDPPYGIAWRCARRTASERFDAIPGDGEIDTSWIPEMARALSPSGGAFVFTRWDVMPEWAAAMAAAGLPIRNCIVWDKGFHGCGDLFGSFAPQHEMILFGAHPQFKLTKRKPDIIRANRVNPNKLVHPAQKPVLVMRHILGAATAPGDIVLDWFSGSGTVAVACKMLGRRYLAFEIDPDTAEMARERVRNTQLPLFVPQPEQISLPLESVNG